MRNLHPIRFDGGRSPVCLVFFHFSFTLFVFFSLFFFCSLFAFCFNLNVGTRMRAPMLTEEEEEEQRARSKAKESHQDSEDESEGDNDSGDESDEGNDRKTSGSSSEVCHHKLLPLEQPGIDTVK
jgi:hypothetical protein